MFNRLLLYFLICLSPLVMAETAPEVPTTLFVQASIGINGDTNYSVTLKMDIGIYKSDVDDPPIWMETFDGEHKIQINKGSFHVVLGRTTPLSADIFIEDGLRIGFTPYINGEKQTTDFIALQSVPYAFHSEISNQAETIHNDDLIKFDFVNMRVGIKETSPKYTLDVGGTVNATTFIGDGSKLTNIQVSDDRLVWLKSPNNPNNIYYTTGNVGINKEAPEALLDINGNTIVSGNLSVGGLLTAIALKGDGSGITNLNASQINQGVIHTDRISGPYTGITGLGEITSGVWKGSPIEDNYIDNFLTLNNAKIEGENTISGNLQLIGETSINGDHALSISSPTWQITGEGDLTLRSITVNNTVFISGNVIQTNDNDGLHIKPTDHLGLYISPTGSIGINTISPSTQFDINGGLRLGMTDTEIPGILRFNTSDQIFEGFRLDKDGVGQWVQLDYDAKFDSHALHAEGNKIKDLIYINASGNVGIGGIPSKNITDHLTVSGNALFMGRSFSTDPLPDLVASGSGTRMFWYPKKTAFRSGYVDSTQWDDENIGQNSVVFGHSGIADSPHTVIIGGKFNTVRGESSVIVGGQNNTIHSNASYSTIIGGGGGSDSGNIIGDGQIASEYSTIVGGRANTITGKHATILGGANNTISGDYSTALGRDITIDHKGVFVYSNLDTPVESTGDGQFLIFAKGNVGISSPPSPDHALSVGGILRASMFVGDGSKLTNISATKLGGYPGSTEVAPNTIYVSDGDGYLPEGSVGAISIKDGSITADKISPGSITGDQINTGAISSNKIAVGAITSDHISPGSITASKIQDYAITSKNIKDGSIASRNIAPNSIKSNHIAMHQVINSKIALDTIDSSRIVDSTVTSKDIALGAIASINIEADAIQAHHIEKATVISDNIAANAIQAQHLDTAIISSRNIQDNAIQSNHIMNFNIENRHISTNAILSKHIASAVIINERIIDNSITSSKITPNAILGLHISDNAIISRHISPNAILERHISDIAIDGSKINNFAITSRNIALKAITNDIIADEAVESRHILDQTIVSKDIAEATIPNSMLAENSITSLNIAEGGIASFNLQDNSISSLNIIDGSITSSDIMDETIDATVALSEGAITSEKIQDEAIQNHHIADGAISSRNFEDASIPWEKITNDPIPVETIADDSIPGTKLKDGTIPGSKIEDSSITAAKLADNSISTNALEGVLTPDKGGTGLEDLSALSGAIVMGVDSSGTVTLGGDKNNLSWDHEQQFLGINTNQPLAALHVNGDILTEDGSVYFGTLDHSISFGEDDTTTPPSGFIIIGPDIAPGGAIDGTTEPKGTLKTNKLIVTDKVGVGIMNPENALDVAGNVAIGANFAGTQAPPNGLIVEGNVGIGTSSPSHALEVNGSILAKGIIGQASESGIGIQGIGGTIGIQSDGANIGIDVVAKEIGIKATSTGETGVSVVITNAADNTSIGLQSELHDDSGNTIIGGLAKLDADYSASVFGTAPNIQDKTNWAAYFDGPVKITESLGIGLDPTTEPEESLHVKENALFEKSIHVKIHPQNSNGDLVIEWDKGNKVSFECDSPRSILFATPSKHGVYFLSVVVNVKNDECKLFFNEDNLKWENGNQPDANEVLINGSHYIFSFILFRDEQYTYYSLEPARFY